MLMAVSAIILLLSTLFTSAILRIRSKTSYLLSLFLIGYSLNILVAEISGFMGLLASRYFFLFLQLIFLAIITIVWLKKGKPSLWGPFSQINLHNGFSKTFIFIKKNLVTTGFGAIVLIGYGILAWLIIRVPPNNSDSMHTHLARVMYWLQQGSFKQLTCFSIFAKIYPFDNNLNFLWTILFSKTDKFVGFVQYFSAFFGAIAIFGLVRLLGGSKRTGFIIGFLWMTFPENVFQATTTQNDLVVTALFTICVFLFFLFIKTRNNENLFLSGLALGLSFGTKETMFMMGLGIIIMLVLFIINRKYNLKPIMNWIAIGTISFILLGSFPYINNLYYYHNPFGPSDHVVSDSFGNLSIAEKLTYNGPRLVFQFISFDSLPTRLADKGVSLRQKVFSTIFTKIGIPLDSATALKETDGSDAFSYDLTPSWNEDVAWFGPVSFLMIIPGFLAGIYFGIKKKNRMVLSLIILCLTFFLFEIILRPGWDPYQGRYFSLSTALAIPLSVELINKNIFSRIYTYLLIIIAVITFLFAVVSNQSKPILGYRMFENAFKQVESSSIPQNPIEQFSRKYELRFLSAFWTNLPFTKTIRDYDNIQLRTLSNQSAHEEIVRQVNQYVPANTVMGVILGGGTFDYVFFGPTLERILVPINPIDLLYDRAWIKEKSLQYVLISNQGRINSVPDYLVEITTVGDWSLYSVKIK
jgi:hypothetical protein